MRWFDRFAWVERVAWVLMILIFLFSSLYWGVILLLHWR